MQRNLKKIWYPISILIVFSLCFYIPLTASAVGTVVGVDPSVVQLRAQSATLGPSVSTPTITSGGQTYSPTLPPGQAGADLAAQGVANQGGTGTAPGTPASSAAGGIAAGAGSCSVGALAAHMLSSAIAGIVGSIFGEAKKKVADAATGAATDQAEALKTQSVPTILVGNSKEHIISIDNGLANLNKKSFSAGASIGGWDGIGTTLSDLFSIPSLDAIGFCIANEMITYIANSTIQWIQTGFKGSPVFISNTNMFMQGIEQQELGNFVNGLSQGILGINLCQPFKVAVLTNTLGAGGYNPLSCTLKQIQQTQYKSFTGGQWGSASNGGGFPAWFSLIQQPNNVYGATLAAQQQAYINITTKQNTSVIDLNWNKGYRNFTACADKSTPNETTGKCANGTPPVTTTLGGYIENQVNARGASGLNRLNIATSFDQVVSALVNELIKIAITDMFSQQPTAIGGSSSSKYGTLNVSCAPVQTTSEPATAVSASSTLVVWSANVTGGSGNFTYAWSGDTNGIDETITNSYTATGTKNATVTVTDSKSSQSASATCSTGIYDALSASCRATPYTGEITWTGSTSGGSGNFSYAWTGDATGTDLIDTDGYSDTGTKTGIFTVFDTSSKNSTTTSCSTSI